MKFTIDTAAASETQDFAERLAAHLAPPDVITLEGDLGAGKTTFAQALARALGVTRTVSSPTFTIVKQYEGKVPLNHLDVYRLEGSDEDFGWDELFYGDAITLVEWAQFIQDELPEDRLDIRILRTGETSRLLELEPHGIHFKTICEAITK
ncbi:tRNA (adenosine(37)-N6)-threonylcarbamoyltransferase complex ATPase subunit type 1 TsaE [Sporosarcina sp. NCCP-2716]|uniref:tRNA (adenosine(37)-N6)-threonylcarbamoyltransferase complex ATPase subunit type 1 TsaE n=1 Tax=Sporosarcina sp. NCCP-2716 TaxID=2943679 RepID=UPI002040E42E|nr:tRNA (adenosine(37)-N6)-threonylcarbamoyltransferase complex ATPase subunit type 1 TsaE [Sporosarcina sp. NCCP-2716]GKV70217.1 tRNA (adenosine(37)-N6)-threonylcarbamoyltransferase complex ATPase subunit type 1 TsaE [Sporosarcina sp. NCCP-2716]